MAGDGRTPRNNGQSLRPQPVFVDKDEQPSLFVRDLIARNVNFAKRLINPIGEGSDLMAHAARGAAAVDSSRFNVNLSLRVVKKFGDQSQEFFLANINDIVPMS